LASFVQESASPAQTAFWRRLAPLAFPVLLLLICLAFYWRLLFSDEYTWINSADMVNQEITRFQFQAARWHAGAFPLWDPYEWCGQPFLAQVVGAANPSTGFSSCFHSTQPAKSPDLGRSRPASLAGALVFALCGFFGSITWIGLMGSFLWAPLVFRSCCALCAAIAPPPVLPTAACSGAHVHDDRPR
jgi:hypothetical protein